MSHLNLWVRSRITPPRTEPAIPQTTIVKPICPALSSCPYITSGNNWDVIMICWLVTLIAIAQRLLTPYYWEMLENGLIQEGRHGVKDPYVDAVSDQEKDVVSVPQNPFNRLRIIQRVRRRVDRATGQARRQRRFGLENCNSNQMEIDIHNMLI